MLRNPYIFPFCICTLRPNINTSLALAIGKSCFPPKIGRTRLRDDLADVDHLRFPGLLGLALCCLHVARKDNVIRSGGVKVPAPERSGGGADASFI